MAVYLGRNLETAIKNLADEAMALIDLESKETILAATTDILADLVSVNTTSSADSTLNQSTTELVKRIKAAFTNIGISGEKDIHVTEQEDPLGQKQAGIVIRINPDKPVGDQRGIALVGHLDTVEAGDLTKWTETGGKPLELTAKGDFLYGLGATDMKGPDANILAVGAIIAKNRDRITQPMYLCFTWGEESWEGVSSVTKGLDELKAKPEVILVPEPTGVNNLVTQHNGFLEMKFLLGSDTAAENYNPYSNRTLITFHGKEAHSGNPALGEDAIRKFLEFATSEKFKALRRKADIRIYDMKSSNPSNVLSEKISIGIEVSGTARNEVSAELNKILGLTKGVESAPDERTTGIRFNQTTSDTFFDDIAPKLLGMFDTIEKDYRQDNFIPNHATMNLYSFAHDENGKLGFGLSVRCNKKNNQDKLKNTLNDLVKSAAEKHGCTLNSRVTSDLSGLPEQDEAALDNHVPRIARALEKAGIAGLKQEVEPGYADSGGIYQWVKERGMGDCLVCQWHPYNEEDWNHIHEPNEYIRKEKDFWPGFKGLMEIVREYTELVREQAIPLAILTKKVLQQTQLQSQK